MRAEMRVRLEQLRKELEVGEFELDKVERRRAHLHETVLRISGAVQVLEELLAVSAADLEAEDDSRRPAAAADVRKEA